MRGKIFRRKSAVLQGGLRFRGVFVMVNRGEVMVNCVVNVVGWMVPFRGEKSCQLFELYLRGTKLATRRRLFNRWLPGVIALGYSPKKGQLPSR